MEPAKLKYTNFDGDWNEHCRFCGNLQKDHQENIGELDGVMYIHRTPCEQEKYEIRKQSLHYANKARFVFWGVELFLYARGKIIDFFDIPLVKLVIGLIKNVWILIKSLFILRKGKPK
ncbi:MAG: hypothetical protein L3J67_03195 [Hyphomicrobiaceae bacterium]|nr:hypothetical protein [Hyphomicrobiaceae bacterium]